jgi:hypothetical protein
MKVDKPLRVWRLWFRDRRPPGRKLDYPWWSRAPVIEITEYSPWVETKTIG